jgi:hypothetical protein
MTTSGRSEVDRLCNAAMTGRKSVLTDRLLTPDLWPALEDLFGESGAVGGCWCMYWRIGEPSAGDRARTTRRRFARL